jgi:plasmid segregation protein ParM
MSTTVRSIDVGYGNTKYVCTRPKGGEIACRLFPSLVSLSFGHDLSDGVIAKRDTVVVEVDGNPYEVGPDVELALRTHTARVLHRDFVGTPEYLALLRGALSYMQVSRIDLLVVGLPVSWLNTKSSELKARLTGDHPMREGSVVKVEKVLVLAQPLGGFIDHALSSGMYGQLRETRNLVIDPGFFTVDWILAKGIQPISERCGSFPGGTSAVLRKLAESIGKEQQLELDDPLVLDRALRTGRLTLYGRELPVARHLAAARLVADEAATAVANSVGDGRDIDAIVLVGGGAEFFRPALGRRFPRHLVYVVPDPVFANVRGFQRAGGELIRRRQVEVA